MIGETATRKQYGCAAYYNGSSPNQNVAILANLNGTPDTIGAALGMPFGTSLWLALALHAIGIEIYIRRLLSSILDA